MDSPALVNNTDQVQPLQPTSNVPTILRRGACGEAETKRGSAVGVGGGSEAWQGLAQMLQHIDATSLRAGAAVVNHQ